jgi:hypothetical protein
VLVRAIKGGKAPAVLYPGLMLNNAPSAESNREVQNILAGLDILPLARL